MHRCSIKKKKWCALFEGQFQCVCLESTRIEDVSLWFICPHFHSQCTDGPSRKKRKTIGERAWTLQFFLREGVSDNWLSLVAWKVNLRACILYPDYSNSFILSNASELFLSRISSFERERNFSCRLFTSSIIREIRHFPVVVVQWRQRNVQKKCDAPAELLSVPIQPLGYCFFDVLVVVASVAS